MALLMMAAQLAAAMRGTESDQPWEDRVRTSGILDFDWMPSAALRWIEIPPDEAALVAWFMSQDADWGDVVVWKSANGGSHVSTGQEPVQAYQDWPARMGYWRAAAGDDRIARILHATYASWNAAMRQYVKIDRMPPCVAFDRIDDEHADIIEMTAALAGALPGSAERLPLTRRRQRAAGPLSTRPPSALAGSSPPPASSRYDQVRRLVLDYGPAITGFCRRWGKDVAERT